MEKGNNRTVNNKKNSKKTNENTDNKSNEKIDDKKTSDKISNKISNKISSKISSKTSNKKISDSNPPNISKRNNNVNASNNNSKNQEVENKKDKSLIITNKSSLVINKHIYPNAVKPEYTILICEPMSYFYYGEKMEATIVKVTGEFYKKHLANAVPITREKYNANGLIEANAYIFGKLPEKMIYKIHGKHSALKGHTGLIDITGINENEKVLMADQDKWDSILSNGHISYGTVHTNLQTKDKFPRVLYIGDTYDGKIYPSPSGATILVHYDEKDNIDSIIINNRIY